jgi:hypothetical protein
MNFNEALPRQAPHERASGVEASTCLRYFFFVGFFFFLTDLCLDLSVHFLIYYKKQFRSIFVKNKD